MKTSDLASVKIAGAVVDPCSVIAGPLDDRRDQQEIEVEIDAAIVLHELQECDVDVTEENLWDFLSTDSRTGPGREGYITFARFILHPLTPLSGPRHTIVAKWAWVETTSVSLDNGFVKFSGKCVPI